MYAEEITKERPFVLENGIFYNFSTFADKVGGHPCWVQGDWTPVDTTGKAMIFIGQLTSISKDYAVYLFFSGMTKETEMVVQYL
jgi:hypothetical protein